MAALDPTEQTLVVLAVSEYQQAVAQAEQQLDARLAPLKAKYAPDGVLSLEPGPNGWQVAEPETPHTGAPKRALAARRKRT